MKEEADLPRGHQEIYSFDDKHIQFPEYVNLVYPQPLILKPLQFVNHETASLKDGHWPSWLWAWLHFEVSFMVWLLVGALGVAIAQDFDLSATQKIFLVGVPL